MDDKIPSQAYLVVFFVILFKVLVYIERHSISGNIKNANITDWKTQKSQKAKC